MPITYTVYPKVSLESGVAWWFHLAVMSSAGSGHWNDSEPTTRTLPFHAVTPKAVFVIEAGDTVTPTDVRDALTVGGPNASFKKWANRLDQIVDNLPASPTEADWLAAFAPILTALARDDIWDALIAQAGWTQISFHQHEGTGGVTDG